MKRRESVIIAADAEAVWPFLADPMRQADWNPKIVSVGRERSGPARLGDRFEMIYRMSGREQESRVEVHVCQPLKRIVFTHRITQNAVDRSIIETYEILPRQDGVQVIQTVDFGGVGIPVLFSVMMWLVSRFGQPVEEPYLDRLKRIVEDTPAD